MCLPLRAQATAGPAMRQVVRRARNDSAPPSPRSTGRERKGLWKPATAPGIYRRRPLDCLAREFVHPPASAARRSGWELLGQSVDPVGRYIGTADQIALPTKARSAADRSSGPKPPGSVTAGCPAVNHKTRHGRRLLPETGGLWAGSAPAQFPPDAYPRKSANCPRTGLMPTY